MSTVHSANIYSLFAFKQSYFPYWQYLNLYRIEYYYGHVLYTMAKQCSQLNVAIINLPDGHQAAFFITADLHICYSFGINNW
ncbi:hypothetical protein T4B_10052 [Trichinella pseudospiralis]|uniref:Uncharacterized protein n=1 Tax=Trichinella pseudospiralis TaxID=6337 RepID=A0A0V1IPU9_TRIPS|nr:hypothetical protein T4A_6432 [Trichinella pseudospiralis]KRZ24721.1 hypothetical protein T4B_10052 [Trichinella pseudospiralis]KRZ30420.1 hypothetical protein T4C_14085 [Trichinella pseudospiralis]